MENKSYLLALNRVPIVGPRTIQKLLDHWPKLQDLFILSATEMLKAGLSDRLVKQLQGVDWRAVENDLKWETSHQNHRLITWDDALYPTLLKEIADPPPVLYMRGQPDVLNYPTLAMVGTRNATILGNETAWRFAVGLAKQGITIVSGLALGIDSQAHRGCLAAEGKTIAVLGTGIDRIYPARNQALAEQIAEKGLIISEFPLQSSPKAGHFPRRNRIISGISLITLVIEAALRSGSLITARYAIEQNRDVLAIPGSLFNAQAQGCLQLLQQGAKLVTSVSDVLEELRGYNQGAGCMEVFTEETFIQKPEKDHHDLSLLSSIGFEVNSIDQIIERSGLPTDAVLRALFALEFQGKIKAVPGGYMRCLQ